MADLQTVDLSSEFISFGFCRELEKESALQIPDTIKQLVHQFSVKYTILAIGSNDFGPLGIGDGAPNGKWIHLRALESTLANTQCLYINYGAMFVRDVFGAIYASGFNGSSHLGLIDDGTEEIRSLTQINDKLMDRPQRSICSRGTYNSHSFVYLVEDNKLYANGQNIRGKFGNGETNHEPQILSPIENFWGHTRKIKKIVAARTLTWFLMEDAVLYACGDYLGTERRTPFVAASNVKDVADGHGHHCLLFEDGKFEIRGSIDATFCDINAINSYFEEKQISIQQISSGISHGIVISDNHECFTFGGNQLAQCGNGYRGGCVSQPHLLRLPRDEKDDDVEFVVLARCGGNHSLILTNKNNVYSFGHNVYSQCSALLAQQHVWNPHLLDREKELGLNQRHVICDVFAFAEESLIVVDPSRC